MKDGRIIRSEGRGRNSYAPETFDAFLEERALETTRIVLFVLAVLYLIVAFGHEQLFSPGAHWALVPLALLLSLGALLGGVAFHWFRPNPRAGRVVLAVTGLLGAGVSVAQFALTGRGKDGISIFMLIIFAGVVMMFRTEAYCILAASFSGWLAVAFAYDLPRLLGSQGMALFLAIATFVVAFESRRATFKRLYNLQRELGRLALTDRLTGLGNRTAIVARITEALARAKRTEAYHFAVCFVDVNELKPINDRYGHEAGDATLCSVAARLNMGRRQNDFVGRIGGDEFVVLLDGIASEEKMALAVRRITNSVSHELPFEGQPIRVIASVGAAWSGRGYASADDLIEAADRAMYRDKLQHARTKTDLRALRRPAHHPVEARTRLDACDAPAAV